MNRSDFQFTAEVRRYVLEHGLGPDAVLADLAAETERRFPGQVSFQIGPEQGGVLEMLVKLIRATRAIEVGTFTGYSSICIARALGPGGRLLACDVSADYTNVARNYWDRAEVADRIELRLAPALDTLRSLPMQPSFDFAFLDADKQNYLAYYHELLPRIRSGGVVVADNVLWSGRVAQPHDHPDDPNLAGVLAFNAHVAADERVTSVMLPISDGMTIALKH